MKFLENTVLPCFELKHKKKEGFKKLKSRLESRSKIMSAMLSKPFEDYVADNNSEIISQFPEFEKLPEGQKKAIRDFALGLQEVNACYTQCFDSAIDSFNLGLFKRGFNEITAKCENELVLINLNANKTTVLDKRIELLSIISRDGQKEVVDFCNENPSLTLDFYVKGGKTIFEFFLDKPYGTEEVKKRIVKLLKAGKINLEQKNKAGTSNLDLWLRVRDLEENSEIKAEVEDFCLVLSHE